MSNKNIMKPQILRLTNSLLLLSFLFFLQFSEKNIYEIILAGCLVITIIVSQLFWANPIKHSTIHRIDGIVAKISLILFIVYVTFYKKIDAMLFYLFLIIMVWMVYFFLLSDFNSRKEWCCNNHILYHGMSHLFCFAGSLFAFV
jgi:hypothetical protein